MRRSGFCHAVPYQFCCSCRCTMRPACHVECQFARPGMRARSTSRGGSPWAGNVRAAGKQTQAGARRQAGVCERIQRASTEFLAVSRRVTRACPSSSPVKNLIPSFPCVCVCVCVCVVISVHENDSCRLQLAWRVNHQGLPILPPIPAPRRRLQPPGCSPTRVLSASVLSHNMLRVEGSACVLARLQRARRGCQSGGSEWLRVLRVHREKCSEYIERSLRPPWLMEQSVGVLRRMS